MHDRFLGKLASQSPFNVLYMILTTMKLAAVAAAAMISVAATHGLGDLHPSVEASKISFLSGIPVGICQPLGRVSFAFTLLEVMGTTKTRRRILYFIILLQFIVGFVGLVLGYGLCNPLRVFWTPSLSKAQACLVKWHTIVVAKWQIFQNGKGLSEYSA